MPNFYSLGTTSITRSDGSRCACAINDSGRIVHLPIRGTQNFEPGQIGVENARGEITPTKVMHPNFLGLCEKYATDWEVDFDEGDGAVAGVSLLWYSSPEIFGGGLQWFDYRPGATKFEKDVPMTPALIESRYLAIQALGEPTQIVRTTFELRAKQESKGMYFTSNHPLPRGQPAWKFKYNGTEEFDRRFTLPAGSLLAVFVAPRGQYSERTWPEDGSVANFYFLKLGTVLRRGP